MDNTWSNTPGSPYYLGTIEEMSDAEYIVNVLGYKNPMDYWEEQDTCSQYRERHKKKSA